MLYLELSSVKNLCSEKVRKFLSIYGYSRVSTSNQDYKTQIQKLERAGAEKIFSEKYTVIFHFKWHNFFCSIWQNKRIHLTK